jgi:hypothetical protein
MSRPLLCSLCCSMLLLTLTCLQTAAQITSPLKVSTDNSRYFSQSGSTIYLTGAHTWPNNEDGWGSPGDCPNPTVFDWPRYLKFVHDHRYNWIRLWTWELPSSISEPFPPFVECHGLLPFARTGPGLATDGQPKFDLTQFNQPYFDRLRQRVLDAQAMGVYVSVMLFDGFGLQFDRFANDGYCFTGANNINGADDGYTGGSSGFNSETLSEPAITAFQDAYVQKVIDTVNDLPNALYEVANEAGGYSVSWQQHMIDLIHNYEATKPLQHPVGFTCMYSGGKDASLFSSNAEYVSPCYSGYGWPVTEDSTGNKVVIDDTDHSWPWKEMKEATSEDPLAMRKWAWENFARGSNTSFMDPYMTTWPDRNNPTGNDVDLYWKIIRNALTQTARIATRVDLAHATPQDALSSTGFCLANAGEQYLVYAPDGGTFSVTLAAGTYTTQWLNASDIDVVTGDPTVSSGGSTNFTAPFDGDAVLLLTVQ